MQKYMSFRGLGLPADPAALLHCCLCTTPAPTPQQCPAQLHEPHTAGNRNVTLRLGTRFYPKQQPQSTLAPAVAAALGQPHGVQQAEPWECTYQHRDEQVSKENKSCSQSKAHGHGDESEGSKAARVLGHLNSWGQEGPVGGSQHDLGDRR